MLSTEVIFCSLMIIFFCFVVNGLAVIMKTRFLIFRKCSDKNGYVCIHCSWGLDLQNGYIPAVHAIVQQGQTGLMFDIMEPISVERSESFYSQLQKIAFEVHKRPVPKSVACRFANVPAEKAVSSQEDYRETVDDEDADEDDFSFFLKSLKLKNYIEEIAMWMITATARTKTTKKRCSN